MENKIKIGDRVKLNNSKDTHIGTVYAVSKPQLYKGVISFYYFVEWDTGTIGLPNGDRIELIKDKQKAVKDEK